jgi:hypothetical protein
MYQSIRDVKDLQLLIDELREFLENKRYALISSLLITYSFSVSSYDYIYVTLLVLCAYYLGAYIRLPLNLKMFLFRYVSKMQ